MGLCAVVRCRCWDDGGVKNPPPHPELVRIDDVHGPLLDLAWKDNADKHKAFVEWLETCCAHPRMERASEWISSWGGLRAFQSQLLEFGVDQFPTLRDVLPHGNDGAVPSHLSRKVLQELEDFAGRDSGTKVVLAEAETGAILQTYIPLYEGWFMCAQGNWTGGVDPNGFFVRGPTGFRAWVGRMVSGVPTQTVIRQANGVTVVRQRSDPLSKVGRWLGGFAERRVSEVFRSMHFYQEQLGPRSFRFIDVHSKRAAVSPIGVSRAPDPGTDVTYPRELIVERRKRNRDEFDYILRPLKIVFEASVETGNPVRWQ